MKVKQLNFPCVFVEYGEPLKRFRTREQLGRFLAGVGDAYPEVRLEDGVYKVCRVTPDRTEVLGEGETLKKAYIAVAENQAKRRYPVLWGHQTIEDRQSIEEVFHSGDIPSIYARRWKEFLGI